MQITASLNGTTATIALRGDNTNTTLTIKDAANLAADLAAFTDPDAQSVDASSFTTSGVGPDQGLPYEWDADAPLANDETNLGSSVARAFSRTDFHPVSGKPTSPGYNVHGKGYRIDATDDGVRITTPPTSRTASEGKVSIPRDQIASIITQLNA